MTEESSPAATVAPPVAIVGQAALEDVRAALPSAHKELVLVQHDGYLLVVASRGHSEEEALYGSRIALAEGFLGWAAVNGEPQIRANLQYVPPDAPPLTDVEKRLQAKSGICAPIDLVDGGFALFAAFVCHGFNVFVLEDLDRLSETARDWADRLGDAAREQESQRWLEQHVPAPAPASADPHPAGDAAGGEEEMAAGDYTPQDVEVLLSVFGVDLTTKSPGVARVLKADVGEVMRRDVRDLFKTPASEAAADQPAPDAEEPSAAADEAAPAADGARADDAGGAPSQPDPEHLSRDDVGQVLSVFGIELKAGDTPLTRALSRDMGSLLGGEDDTAPEDED